MSRTDNSMLIISSTYLILYSSGEYESEHLRYVQQQSLRKTIFEKYSWSHRVEGLVVNHYWRDNNGIWTPWIVRCYHV